MGQVRKTIDGSREIEFPDGMAEADIDAAMAKLNAQITPKTGGSSFFGNVLDQQKTYWGNLWQGLKENKGFPATDIAKALVKPEEKAYPYVMGPARSIEKFATPQNALMAPAIAALAASPAGPLVLPLLAGPPVIEAINRIPEMQQVEDPVERRTQQVEAGTDIASQVAPWALGRFLGREAPAQAPPRNLPVPPVALPPAPPGLPPGAPALPPGGGGPPPPPPPGRGQLPLRPVPQPPPGQRQLPPPPPPPPPPPGQQPLRPLPQPPPQMAPEAPLPAPAAQTPPELPSSPTDALRQALRDQGIDVPDDAPISIGGEKVSRRQGRPTGGLTLDEVNAARAAQGLPPLSEADATAPLPRQFRGDLPEEQGQPPAPPVPLPQPFAAPAAPPTPAAPLPAPFVRPPGQRLIGPAPPQRLIGPAPPQEIAPPPPPPPEPPAPPPPPPPEQQVPPPPSSAERVEKARTSLQRQAEEIEQQVPSAPAPPTTSELKAQGGKKKRRFDPYRSFQDAIAAAGGIDAKAAAPYKGELQDLSQADRMKVIRKKGGWGLDTIVASLEESGYPVSQVADQLNMQAMDVVLKALTDSAFRKTYLPGRLDREAAAMEMYESGQLAGEEKAAMEAELDRLRRENEELKQRGREREAGEEEDISFDFGEEPPTGGGGSVGGMQVGPVQKALGLGEKEVPAEPGKGRLALPPQKIAPAASVKPVKQKDLFAPPAAPELPAPFRAPAPQPTEQPGLPITTEPAPTPKTDTRREQIERKIARLDAQIAFTNERLRELRAGKQTDWAKGRIADDEAKNVKNFEELEKAATELEELRKKAETPPPMMDLFAGKGKPPEPESTWEPPVRPPKAEQAGLYDKPEALRQEKAAATQEAIRVYQEDGDIHRVRLALEKLAWEPEEIEDLLAQADRVRRLSSVKPQPHKATPPEPPPPPEPEPKPEPPAGKWKNYQAFAEEKKAKLQKKLDELDKKIREQTKIDEALEPEPEPKSFLDPLTKLAADIEQLGASQKAASKEAYQQQIMKTGGKGKMSPRELLGLDKPKKKQEAGPLFKEEPPPEPTREEIVRTTIDDLVRENREREKAWREEDKKPSWRNVGLLRKKQEFWDKRMESARRNMEAHPEDSSYKNAYREALSRATEYRLAAQKMEEELNKPGGGPGSLGAADTGPRKPHQKALPFPLEKQPELSEFHKRQREIIQKRSMDELVKINERRHETGEMSKADIERSAELSRRWRMATGKNPESTEVMKEFSQTLRDRLSHWLDEPEPNIVRQLLEGRNVTQERRAEQRPFEPPEKRKGQRRESRRLTIPPFKLIRKRLEELGPINRLTALGAELSDLQKLPQRTTEQNIRYLKLQKEIKALQAEIKSGPPKKPGEIKPFPKGKLPKVTYTIKKVGDTVEVWSQDTETGERRRDRVFEGKDAKEKAGKFIKFWQERFSPKKPPEGPGPGSLGAAGGAPRKPHQPFLPMKATPLSIEDKRQALDFKIRTVAQRHVRAVKNHDNLAAKALKQELEGLMEKREEIGDPSEIRNLPWRRQIEILNKKIKQAEEEWQKLHSDDWNEAERAMEREKWPEGSPERERFERTKHGKEYRERAARMDKALAKLKALRTRKDDLIDAQKTGARLPIVHGEGWGNIGRAHKIVDRIEDIAIVEAEKALIDYKYALGQIESKKGERDKYNYKILDKRNELTKVWADWKKEHGLTATDVLEVFNMRLRDKENALKNMREMVETYDDVEKFKDRVHTLQNEIEHMRLERHNLIGAVRQEWRFVPTMSVGEEKPFHHGTGPTETIGILKNKGTLKGRLSGWGGGGGLLGPMPMGGGIIPQLSWMGEDITKDPLVFVSPHPGTPYTYGKNKTGYSVLTGRTSGDPFDYTYQHGPPFVILEGRIAKGTHIYHGIPRSKEVRKKDIGKRFPEVVVKHEIPNFLRKIRISPEVILDEEGQEMIRLATEAGYPVEVISTPGERFDIKKRTGKNVWRQTAAQRQFSRAAQGKVPADTTVQADLGSIEQRKGLTGRAKALGKRIEDLQAQVDPYSTNRKKQGEIQDQIQDLRNKLQEELPEQSVFGPHDITEANLMSDADVVAHAERVMDDIQAIFKKPKPDSTDLVFLRENWQELLEINEGFEAARRERYKTKRMTTDEVDKAYPGEAKMLARMDVVLGTLRRTIGGVQGEQYIKRKNK
jgi:hypothetical protein